VALPFTRTTIADLAGYRSFERGLGYLDSVEDLKVAANRITATVYGSSRYRVRLSLSGDGLSGECSCPYGQDGAFCKHCVATALLVLELGDDAPRDVEAVPGGNDHVAAWLMSLDKDDLVAEVLAILDDEPELRRRFELRAATDAADTEAIRDSVHNLIEIDDDYVDYRGSWDYAGRVSQAAATIESLAENGSATDAMFLAREALDLLGENYELVDDSSGEVGGAAHELLSAHLRACQIAQPDPGELGEYLAELALTDDYGFEPDSKDYADLLGEAGTAALHAGIAAAFAAAPDHWRARHLMGSVVRASGNVDALVAVYAANLDSAGRGHLRIARELDTAGRGDEALDWAERGLRESAHPGDEFVSYLTGRYRELGRAEDAVRICRERLAAEKSLAAYRRLRETSAEMWPAEQEAARRLLGDEVLIAALLEDKDTGAAWTLVASMGGKVAPMQLVRLAHASRKTHPAEALAVYLQALGPLYSLTGDETYRTIAAYLAGMRDCHQALGTLDEFTVFMDALRASQKRKRNLITIVDQHNL
jgi:hypothetical protein